MEETGKSTEPEEPAQTDQPEKTGQPEETDSTDKTATESESDHPTLKDEQVGTYLSSREQRDEMDSQYKMLSAEYEREFGTDLEKNRHFYPLVIKYGLDRLVDATALEVRSLLEKLNY
ncbi:hypothetical protein [Haloterrigena turkmenica]|nr:hypothetical protein [Haloterrigena turkmenica]